MIDLYHTVTARIQITDMTRARDCAQWLIEHIGPQQPGTVGNIVHGHGWQICVLAGVFLDGDCFNHVAVIELNQHVDEQDVLMFLLRWS